MFDSVLIANRGEIARRIIRTAKAMGLRTVAVYSEADIGSPHVREADEAYCIGAAPASESYLSIQRVLDAAQKAGVGAIHPGYGFLSENEEFARAVEAAGIVFVGPTPEQLRLFGVKHTARSLAEASNVPLLPGTGLLEDAEEAVAEATRVGLPVMVKASNGGGGIGMQVCSTEDEVRSAYADVKRIARQNFGSGGVFLERLVRPARHVEVQVFGDGAGRVAIFGDRDCSLQRRNQKVIEEAPAPKIPESVRRSIHEAASALASSVKYRSAGTVEFIYDPSREEAYFLEMNTRLQVEHPVTEAVFGVDLVELMLLQAGAKASANSLAKLEDIYSAELSPIGHAVEARIYAEDPGKQNSPSAGLITGVEFPSSDDSRDLGIRIDSWIEPGTEVSTNYDPMLAKLICYGDSRKESLERLGEVLRESKIHGIVTNLGYLSALTSLDDFRNVEHSTVTLADSFDPQPRIDVLDGGMQTTIQDYPGRTGYWQIGVPPSGPMDNLSFRLANRIVGNPEGTAALECTATGPKLKFSFDTTVAVTGAEAEILVDEEPVSQWEPILIRSGQVLTVGSMSTVGMRCYIAVSGGFDVPEYMGSKSTFTLGRFGGHGGRALRIGDVLRLDSIEAEMQRPRAISEENRPKIENHWRIAVTVGPHEAPEFFAESYIESLYSTDYKVHLNSARTGVRLVGPKPEWTRADGGEAGLHPSNIHDTAYAVGALDFTGDTPIILGPDGPSLGGFVCPAVVASGDLWKLGQLRPGDTVRFVPVSESKAASVEKLSTTPEALIASGDDDHGILHVTPAKNGHPKVTYRRAGDTNLLVEYGELALDIGLRMRVHALHMATEEHGITGVTDLTPGIRSLQIQVDPNVILPSEILPEIKAIDAGLPETDKLTVPSRKVRLPLSWDDPQTRLAIERYMNGVRDDAPWCPWNIEFIRRVNGLPNTDAVYDVVFNASYLVLGLGDVYLGAPVATPLDPRHRLVTTKYNPARTWTPENAVGIGGAYLCVYGMEGPGGYQFVGRTTQMWNRFRKGGLFEERPWALRFFDRIEWYPVDADQLLEMRAKSEAGMGIAEVEDGVFSYAEYKEFLEANSESIKEFKTRQEKAFDEEKDRWLESGEFDEKPEPEHTLHQDNESVEEGVVAVRAPLTSNLWQISVEIGQLVKEGDQIFSLEAMKMETPVVAPCDGTVASVFASVGEQVDPGQLVLGIRPA